MAISKERIACLFWTGAICALVCTILYTSLCILKITEVSRETCGFLEVGSVASVLVFIVGVAYYCYRQKSAEPGSDNLNFFPHWTVTQRHHYRSVPKESEVMTPIAVEDLPSEFECSICSDGKGDEIVVQLKCLHYYHKSCIQKWFISDQDMSCPLCRKTQVRTEQLVVVTMVPVLPPIRSQV